MNTIKIKFDRHGNVRKVITDAGITRRTKAAGALWAGVKIEPGFGYKFRRFFVRAFRTLNAKLDKFAEVAEFDANELPYIGLEEHINGL